MNDPLGQEMTGWPEHDAAGLRARLLLDIARRRDEALGPDQVGTPGWEMMLFLFSAGEEGRFEVLASELCSATRLPIATAQRWLGVLAAAGKVRRVPDRQGRGREFVRLCASAAEQVRDVLRDRP